MLPRVAGPAVTGREGARVVLPVEAPAFTGRDEELGALGEVLAGRGAVVLVEGELGIGKSRLVNEYLGTGAGRAARAVVACCPPFRQPQTLGPVADAVGRAVGDVGGLGLSALGGALRPLFPEWSDVLPAAPEPAEDATAARNRLFRALGELLGCLGTGLLVLEDAHWADEATLEFLLFLASRPAGGVPAPSLLVTSRPEDVPAGSLLPRLVRLAPGGRGLRLALGPLTEAETAALVSSMLGTEQVTAGFTAFLHEQAGGVPLAVEESVRLLAARADLTCRDGRWVRRRLGRLAVPPSVRDSVLERSGRLGRDAQEVLSAAAVLAEPAREDVLTAVAGLDRDRARCGLSEALGCALLAEDERGMVSFRHALGCRAVYEAVAGPARRLLHLRAGEALAELGAPAATLARHFCEAGETTAWLRHAEQAAGLALAAGDQAASATLLAGLVSGAGLAPGETARLMDKIVLLALPEESQDHSRNPPAPGHRLPPGPGRPAGHPPEALDLHRRRHHLAARVGTPRPERHVQSDLHGSGFRHQRVRQHQGPGQRRRGQRHHAGNRQRLRHRSGSSHRRASRLRPLGRHKAAPLDSRHVSHRCLPFECAGESLRWIEGVLRIG
jgi:hypothetical protein